MSLSFARHALAVAVGIALSSLAPAASPPQAQRVAAAEPAVEAIAAAARDGRQILLRSGLFDPLAQQLDARDAVPGLADAAASPRYALVQFDSRGAAARRALQARGAQLLGYVPNNAYYVRLDGIDLGSLRAAQGVRWAGAVAPAWKIDPRLWSARRSELQSIDGAQVALEIELFPGEDSAAVLASLQQAVPALDVLHAGQRLRLGVDKAALDALLAGASQIEAVQFIAPWAEPQLRNAGSVGVMQGNATAACGGGGAVCGPTPLWDQGLVGGGQIVAVADSGLDRDEAWFTTLDKGAGPVTAITTPSSDVPPLHGPTFPLNKVYAYWVQPGATAGDNNLRCRPTSALTGFHGTHVNGTVAGDTAGTFGAVTYLAATPQLPNHELADGMAPNAQLLFQDIGNDTSGCLSISDFANTLRQSHTGGGYINSNSWGAPSFGAYGGNDGDADRVTREAEDLLVVIAAGNDGDLTAAEGCPAANLVGAICTRSVGTPANAKNALSVGALAHAGVTTIAGFSSRGPTTDGRIKPDIMAPGSAIVSAAGDAATTASPQAPLSSSKSGTSMATPTIAGSAALLREYFMDGFYPRGARTAADTLIPSGPVMKAVLLNGTRVLENWPSNNTGWGRAWLDGNLWFSATTAGGDDTRRLRLFERTNSDGLDSGESHSYTINNVQSGAELRATLTWYDLPASSIAAATLVNNLDLEVSGPGGVIYRGNVFAAGASVTGGTADTLNTVEQVRLAAPTAGSYTFRVIGTSVPGNGEDMSDRQGYGLAVSGAFGLPDQPALAAPTGLTLAGNDPAGVRIAFTPPPGAQGFQLYRANGSCAAMTAGSQRLVGSSASSPISDTRSVGGFSYAYVVRAIGNDVEGQPSACIDVASADNCELLPQPLGFTGSDASNASCGVSLGWSASNGTCPAPAPAGVSYKVLRSDTPAFTAPQTVAANLATLSYTDNTVINGRAYFYKAVAVDGVGNERYSSLLAATPSGSAGPDTASFADNADNKSYMVREGSWIFSSAAAADGSFSYHTGPEGTNSANCAALRSETLLVKPDSTLSYKARYNLESEWDGVVVEISTDGGTTWTDLPPEGGYPGSFAQTGNPPGNLCGYAAAHGAFSGATTAASNAGPNETPMGSVVFKPFRSSLAAYAGQQVMLRWRVSSDSNTDYGGFWLDSVRIGGADVVFDDTFDPQPASAHVCN
jgi:Subtilase family